MYSVIIHSKKTKKILEEYKFIFDRFIGRDDVGFCKWNENGKDIKTALPGLLNMIDDKEEWRAIIVRYCDDVPMSKYDTAPDNPYDFDEITHLGDTDTVSDVPLVRLTQILGGVPQPEVSLRPVLVEEELRPARIEYVIDEDTGDLDKRNELQKELSFDGKKPKSIIMLSVREKDSFGITDNNNRWETVRESDSSMFWKRNKYPSNCRFLVYDMTKEGKNQRIADDIVFWLSVYMLAVNEISPSVLQAYRVYNIKTLIDKSSLKKLLQDKSDYLRLADKQIKKEIQAEKENEDRFSETLPDFFVKVPVNISLSSNDSDSIEAEDYCLVSKDHDLDLRIWQERTEEIEKDLRKNVVSAERSLDKSAAHLRDNNSTREEDAVMFNTYQEEDIKKAADGLFFNVIRGQGELPSFNVLNDDETAEIKKEIKKKLSVRILKNPAIVVFIIAISLLFTSCIPVLVRIINGKSDSVFILIICLAIAAAVITGFSLIYLLVKKYYLNKLIGQYTDNIENAYLLLSNNAGEYSRYLSMIATHQKATAYKDLSDLEKESSEKLSNSFYNEYEYVDIFRKTVEKVAKAFYVDIDPLSDLSEKEEKRWDRNEDKTLFSLETGESYQAELNNSGHSLYSPFSFIEGLSIVREELYDSDEHN